MNDSYEDILHLPHPTSKRHPRMSAINRAAQFSPFAALTGYDDAIEETARKTDRQIVLTDSEREELDRKLHFLADAIHKKPFVLINYFVPDNRKEGGSYSKIDGHLRRVDFTNQTIQFCNGFCIDLSLINDISCSFFSANED